VSRSTVPRLGDAHGLQPHRLAPGKLAQDPACVEQLTAGVGLDRNPPDQAVVLGGDEKSPRQALDRPQPGLPRQPGQGGTLTHDSQRHGPPTLCAAWHGLPGEVLGPGPGRPRPQEFLQFLRRLDRAFPRDRTLHVILDHSATPQHQTVRQGLAARPRCQLHCTPTGASWLHLGESWCSQLPQQRLRRGIFCSGPELVAAIQDYWTHHHANRQPCVGSTTVEALLAKARKCKIILGEHH